MYDLQFFLYAEFVFADIADWQMAKEKITRGA